MDTIRGEFAAYLPLTPVIFLGASHRSGNASPWNRHDGNPVFLRWSCAAPAVAPAWKLTLHQVASHPATVCVLARNCCWPGVDNPTMPNSYDTSGARAGIYLQFSLEKQAATTSEIAELEDFCRRANWTASQYADSAAGDPRASRPGRDRLLRDAKSQRIDVVVVLKLECFGRSLRDSGLALRFLKSGHKRPYNRKVHVVTPGGTLSTNVPFRVTS